MRAYSRKTLFQITLAALVFFNCMLTALARNDDVVILKNGDRITGEIKGLRHGELSFQADYMENPVQLDWKQVERLESKGRFRILLTDGQLFTDSVALAVAKSQDSENFIIGAHQQALRVKQREVFRITPVEGTFWSQLTGSVNYGFSFTSGNKQYQTELSANVSYSRGDHTYTVSTDSVFSGQTQGSRTSRKQLTFDYRKQLSSKWYAGGVLDFLKSDQQSLDLRTTVGGLVGRNLIHTDRTRLSVFGGAAVTREKYTQPIDQRKDVNADALAGVDFLTFRFKTANITSRFILFPSLTVPGRVRMQTTNDVNIQLVKDLYWNLHLYENFDSKPPVRADKNDLGISTGLGWKF